MSFAAFVPAATLLTSSRTRQKPWPWYGRRPEQACGAPRPGDARRAARRRSQTPACARQGPPPDRLQAALPGHPARPQPAQVCDSTSIGEYTDFAQLLFETVWLATRATSRSVPGKMRRQCSTDRLDSSRHRRRAAQQHRMTPAGQCAKEKRCTPRHILNILVQT